MTYRSFAEQFDGAIWQTQNNRHTLPSAGERKRKNRNTNITNGVG